MTKKDLSSLMKLIENLPSEKSRRKFVDSLERKIVIQMASKVTLVWMLENFPSAVGYSSKLEASEFRAEALCMGEQLTAKRMGYEVL